MNLKATSVGSSIFFIQHENQSLRQEVLCIIEQIFPKDEVTSVEMDVHDYRHLMLCAQNALNEMEIGNKIVKSLFPALSELLKTEDILIQSNVYLRASRPTKQPNQENIGWHRETFYGANMHKALNIWTPIKGVNEDNTLQYIPESHLIPENNIIIEQSRDSITEQFSDGHKLGFQYKPKQIIGGVNFNSREKMNVPIGTSAIFDGNLIHGAAENKSSTIRFSLDFRILRKKDYTSENKSFHLSSGKPYFVEFQK